jgi:hypothetical protein
MAGKAAINQENLTALGAEKLARLVLEASARDSGFKRLVAAALAGAKGPEAVAAVIDRKISALERARGFVEWDRAKTFAADLDMTVKTIVDELGPADPFSAVERLLRFIATHQAVFERIDDSQGRVQDIYETAVDALRPFVAATPVAERERLPDTVMAALGKETHGFLPMVVSAVAADLPAAALARWDAALTARQAAIPGKSDGSRGWSREAGLSGLIACRQALAEARGDLDGFIALEEAKHPNLQNTLEIAERLIAAGRATEALQWVRRMHGRRVGYISSSGMADGSNARDLSSNRRVSLEARILESLGDRAAAQDLRWSSFTTTLDVGMLREHVAHLEDFAEFDVLDRAFDHVSSAAAAYSALTFFIEWPKLDRAAKLVVERHNVWDGRHYHVLLPAAQALEETQPAAATVLYRAMLNDILTRAKSPAYAHGAKYLARLNELAAASDAVAVPNVNSHATFKAELAKAHGRKTGFWSQVRTTG